MLKKFRIKFDEFSFDKSNSVLHIYWSHVSYYAGSDKAQKKELLDTFNGVKSFTISLDNLPPAFAKWNGQKVRVFQYVTTNAKGQKGRGFKSLEPELWAEVCEDDYLDLPSSVEAKEAFAEHSEEEVFSLADETRD